MTIYSRRKQIMILFCNLSNKIYRVNDADDVLFIYLK